LEFDEVFISDGAKCDVGNIQELFSADCRIAVTDPVYPVYVDSNAMAGRAGDYGKDGKWTNLTYLACNEENGFVPSLPKEPVDVIYLCYPNNPTGTTLTREQLKAFVDYARESGSLIIYDSAYRAYVTRPNIPLSIYEIEGAKDVAIECNSFSKTAGFTGTRCAYTVVPHAVKGLGAGGEKVALNDLWKRRMATKFNGVSYPVQAGAAAVYTKEGQKQIKATIAYYMENAKIIRDALVAQGMKVFGGVDAPYIWLKVPEGMTSWEFFDILLTKLHLVGTPGSGFGPSGEGYFRLTAFNTKEKTLRATERLKNL
jgi:LL-diaminopimelate aminotransferase